MNNPYGYIYHTQRISTGEVYAGQKKGPWNPKYLGSGVRLTRAVASSGRGDFKVWLSQYAKDAHELNDLEKVYIRELKELYPKDKVLNISDGGIAVTVDGVSYAKGYKATDEAKKKMSESRSGCKNYWFGKGHMLSGEKNPMFGKIQSAETRAKISARLKGKGGPSHKNTGKVRSAEHCAKISAAKKGGKGRGKGWKMTEGQKQVLREKALERRRLGIGIMKFTPEILQKMSEKMKAARARKYWSSR